MSHATIANWSNLAGGLAVVALGIFVLSVRPRVAGTTWFGVFALGFGGYFALTHGAAVLDLPGASIQVALFVLSVISVSGATIMALTFPRPLEIRERRLGAFFLVLTLALIILRVWATLERGRGFSLVGIVGGGFIAIPLVGGLVLLALRYRVSSDPDLRRQLALAAAGVTVFVGFVSTYGSATIPNGPLNATGADLVVVLVSFVVVLGVATIWLLQMKGPDARTARALAWLTLGTMLAGLVLAAIPLEGGHGIARVLLAAIIAYAALRHQLLGIDVKVRFAISKSTIAAVFIAVFFIASETAQQFFGETLGSTYVGIAAAGLLVFTMAPLQRVAERLAEKAVPIGLAVAPSVGKEESFKKAIRLALRDRLLTRSEETHLHELAQDLGISGPRAHALLAEAEADLGESH